MVLLRAYALVYDLGYALVYDLTSPKHMFCLGLGFGL
jgi:hypothetical protein